MTQRGTPSPVITARKVIARESLFYCVATFQSFSYSLRSKSNFFSTLLQCFRDSIYRDKPIGGAVVRLFFPCGPSNVPYLIRQIIIDAVNSVFRARLWPKMFAEFLKLIKRSNDNSPLIPIQSKFRWFTGVDASRHHAMPATPLWGVGHSVPSNSGTLPQASAFPTGSGLIVKNPVLPCAGFPPTVTDAPIESSLFGVNLDQFFYGQLVLAIASFKHQFIVFDTKVFVQGEIA